MLDEKMVRCEECGGAGMVEDKAGSHLHKCRKCDGEGRTHVPAQPAPITREEHAAEHRPIGTRADGSGLLLNVGAPDVGIPVVEKGKTSREILAQAASYASGLSAEIARLKAELEGVRAENAQGVEREHELMAEADLERGTQVNLYAEIAALGAEIASLNAELEGVRAENAQGVERVRTLEGQRDRSAEIIRMALGAWVAPEGISWCRLASLWLAEVAKEKGVPT